MGKKEGYKIGIIPGDGVGPEVIREGLKVLKSAGEKFGIKYDFVNYDFGGERYLKTGEVLPDSTLKEFKQLDAILLGAVGHPEVKTGILEQGLLLKIRFGLDQYINLRPVKLFPGVDTPLANKKPEDIDYCVVRENTEGAYCGSGGFFKKGTSDEIAIQESINTKKGVERCVRYAYELTKGRNKKKELTLSDKANVLTFEGDLWRRTFRQVGKEYPEIKQNFALVDATCMWMVKNPEWFDVIVTSNLFGDIITDLAAVTQGGMGIAAGANINPEGVSMFEPIHGSAPKYTGKNVICPLATIAAGAMMLKILGEEEAAKTIEKAIMKLTGEGRIKSLQAGRMGLSTEEVGDLVAKFI